jgi:hypothetical protein
MIRRRRGAVRPGDPDLIREIVDGNITGVND